MRVVGKDANGFPRVYGTHEYVYVAEAEARKAAIEYVKRRPDTGPLSAWTFELQQST